MKRALSFIDFLSSCLPEKDIQVLYLGREKISPWIHLFPHMTFHVYSSFSKSTEQMVCHCEDFSLQVAQGWSNSSQIVPLYLMADQPEQIEEYSQIIQPRSTFLSTEISPAEEENILRRYLGRIASSQIEEDLLLLKALFS